MNKVIAYLKNIRWTQILTVFLAGVLVFVSSACSGTASAKTDAQLRKEGVNSAYQGGMNNYSDADPRRDTAPAGAKAKTLIDNAKKNLNQSVDSSGELGENIRQGAPLGKRIERLGENVGKSTQEVTEGLTKGTQKGARNIRENTQNAAEDVSKTASRSAEDAKDQAQKAARDVSQKTSRAAEDAADFVGDKSNQATKATQRAVENATDAID